MATAWNVSKYGPEKTPYLDTFHAVDVIILNLSYHIFSYNLVFVSWNIKKFKQN